MARLETLSSDVRNLRSAFTLVPWRMRPKLLAILVGSAAVALLDMAAVVLILPIMQIVSGTAIQDSTVLSLLADVTGQSDAQRLLVLVLVIVVVLMLAKNLFSILFRWWSLGVMARAQSDAAHEVMSLYMSSPWIHHRRRSSDDVFQTLNIYLPAAFGGITTGVIALAVDVISIAVILIALTLVSPIATLIALLFFGGAALVIQWSLKQRILDLGERTRVENLKAWGYLSPAIDGFKEVRLAGASQRFADNYAHTRRQVARFGRKIQILGELPRYLLEIMMILGIMVIALALFATSPQNDAFAFLGVFAVAAVRIVPSLNRVVATLGAIRSNLPNLQGLADEIDRLRGESGRDIPISPTLGFTRDDIRIDAVTFQYPDSEVPVLDSISGVIPEGHTVALVGSSGAGKTTFVELLLTLLEPSAGSITVGGVSIHDHPVSWREQLGVVTQDVYLQDCSIRENIAFGVDPSDIDEERVIEAVKMAQLRDFVADMPQGLDTLVGYRGTRISGGQKQRIGIARALYRQPQVLVLDEATSALDNETEARITETIKTLHGAMTIIVVAHRLSTVKHADDILFFSGGRIAARGTMAELSSTNREFAELVRLGRLS